MEILAIEDDPTVQTLIKIVLENDGHQVKIAETVQSGSELALNNGLDMIILDLGLPDGNGYEICKEVRNKELTTPILVLSAEKETDIKVQCLEIGADDYLTKPFDTSEFTARIDAIRRRSNGSKNRELLCCDELVVNLMERTVKVGPHEIDLTNNEFDLLAFLLEKQGETVSKNEIAENVWDIKFDTQTNYINVYMSYLRKKIRAHTEKKYIQTIRNKGFVIQAP